MTSLKYSSIHFLSSSTYIFYLDFELLGGGYLPSGFSGPQGPFPWESATTSVLVSIYSLSFVN